MHIRVVMLFVGFVAAACDEAPQGPAGPSGPSGADGAAGPAGEAGAPGTSGTTSWTDAPGQVTTAVAVGVGTDTPDAALHIHAEGEPATLVLDATPAGAQVVSTAVEHRRAGVRRWWVGAASGAGADNYAFFRAGVAGNLLGTALTLERSTGNVGVGVDAPEARMHVGATDENAVLILEATGAGQDVASAVEHRRAGSTRWWVGASGNDGTDNYDFFRYDDSGAFIGTALTVARGTGNVGVGEPAPAFALHVNGTICQDTDGDGACDGAVQSDARLKRDVATLRRALARVKALRGVSFRWRDDVHPSRHYGDGTRIGFVAQEVERVLPELVYADRDGFKLVDYPKVTAVLAEAVQEQDARLDDAYLELRQLRRRVRAIEDLEARVARLEEAP